MRLRGKNRITQLLVGQDEMLMLLQLQEENAFKRQNCTEVQLLEECNIGRSAYCGYSGDRRRVHCNSKHEPPSSWKETKVSSGHSHRIYAYRSLALLKIGMNSDMGIKREVCQREVARSRTLWNEQMNDNGSKETHSKKRPKRNHSSNLFSLPG